MTQNIELTGVVREENSSNEDQPLVNFCFKFTVHPAGEEYSTRVPIGEMLFILNSGMIKGKQIDYIRIWNEGDFTVYYDFTLAKQGKPAWRADKS